MAKRAALNLDTMLADKPKPAASTTPQPTKPLPPNKASDGRKGMTLRLNPAAWRELKLLAVEQECAAHDLLIESLNLLLVKHGRPPVA